MAQYIEKSAVVAEINRLHKAHSGRECCDEVGINLEYLEDFINTLKVIDPYERCVQYPSVEDALRVHAETYSFNIESELFHQLTKEQQKLWRKEIEYACISGGDAGYSLAKDIRYKENLDSKGVDFDTLSILADHLIDCYAHGIIPKYNEKELDLLERIRNLKVQKTKL